MKLDEKKIVEYLRSHIGENTNAYRLIEDSKAYEGNLKDDDVNLFEFVQEVWDIAKKNGFRLNNDHNRYRIIGLPWIIDFYIEESAEKILSKIMKEDDLSKRAMMIEEAYGIYENNELIGFTVSIPWQIKKVYDESWEDNREV